MPERPPRAAPRPLSSGSAGLDLVDRGEPALEPAPGGTEVEPPDAHALRAGQAHGLVQALVEPARPVAERDLVVAVQALHVVGHEPGSLDGELDARQMERCAVGKDVALRERPGLGIAHRACALSRDSAAARPGAWRVPVAARTRRSGPRPRARPCRCSPLRRTDRRAARGSRPPGSRRGRRGRAPVRAGAPRRPAARRA